MHDRAERIGASFTLITEIGRVTEIVVLWMSDPGRAKLKISDPKTSL